MGRMKRESRSGRKGVLINGRIVWHFTPRLEYGDPCHKASGQSNSVKPSPPSCSKKRIVVDGELEGKSKVNKARLCKRGSRTSPTQSPRPHRTEE